jgi:5-methylcytosine-specific restriction enzyme A
MKAAVFKRDRGICALCLADTQDQRRMLKKAKRQGAEAVARLAERWGIPMHRVRGQLWDADHIISCVEGGEDHPSNLQTLCLRCHATRTEELRIRRKVLQRSEAG